MATEDRHVRKGNIATYDNASDAFLARRKEDLRSGIRNPGLTTGEFIREVFSHMFVAALAVGISVWNIVDRFIQWGMKREDPLPPEEQKFHKFFAIYETRNGQRVRTSTYVSNAGAFESHMRKISYSLASTFSKDGGHSFDKICQQALDMAKHMGFQSGVDGLIKLREELGTITSLDHIPKEHSGVLESLRAEYRTYHNGAEMAEERLLEAYKCKRLYWFLKELVGKHPNSGIGQIFRVWERMGEIAKEAGVPGNTAELGADAFTHTLSLVKAHAVDFDNKLIIRTFSMPTTAVLAGTVALVTGMQAYKFAKRQKALDNESELTHIERLERERAAAKAANSPRVQ